MRIDQDASKPQISAPDRAAEHRSRRAFTLVELLVVIAIIGVLIALLLPAVQAAREAARRSQCASQLKNLSLGMINHESTHGNWPSSGWPGAWSADPDRGTGAKQPGNWLFATLPFLEDTALYEMGSGLSGAARREALQQRDATPMAITNCPSRREGGPYPFPLNGTARTGDGAGGVLQYQYTRAARCDYAANVGDETNFDSRCRQINPPDYYTGVAGFPPKLNAFTGVSFCGRAVESRVVVDGLSKTIVIGEKWVPTQHYETGSWAADDWQMFVGFQDDTVRSTYYNGFEGSHTPRPDTADPDAIASDVQRELFGSAHPGGCQFAMCDGSVSLLVFDIEPEAFRQLGHRADGGEPKPTRRSR